MELLLVRKEKGLVNFTFVIVVHHKLKKLVLANFRKDSSPQIIFI